MHSFKPSLSFLLSLFLLPLLQSKHLSFSDPPASLAFAQAAGIEAKNGDPPIDLNGNATSENPRLQAANTAAHHGFNPRSLHSDANPLLRRRHGSISRASSAIEERQPLSLHPGRRAAGAQFTNYVTGLGACGTYNVPSDYVVALNMEQWDNGAHCNAPVTITIQGKTVHATIVDRCKGCGFNNIDLTDGLFSVWGDPVQLGVLQGEWEYGSGGGDAAPKTTTTPPAPKPTSTKIPVTSTKPVPTSTKITPSSTHTSVSTKITSSTSESSTGSASATSTASVPIPTSQDVENLGLLYLINLGIGGIAFSSLKN